MRHFFRIILSTLLLYVIFISCSEYKPDARLVTIERIASASADKALDSLELIDYDKLSDDDRQYYDFLKVKVPDKAYETHTSDSLILIVIENERRHQERGRYPEALYYGGRVYHDMGDFPTALKYYQSSLEIIPEDSAYLHLKGAVLSQTAGLLNHLRLYSQAIPYLKSTLEIDSITNDSTNLIYDLLLLGVTYMRSHAYQEADYYLTKAAQLSKTLGPAFEAKSAMYLAAVKHYLGDNATALNLIRDIPDRVRPLERNTALAYAAEIYYTAGLYDSAYIHALNLIRNEDRSNAETGYHILLTNEIRDKIPEDSISMYLSEYLDLLEGYYNENDNQLSITQQSSYNYDKHEQKREEAEKSRDSLKLWLLFGACVILVLGIIILYLKIRNQRNLIQLHKAISNINELTLSLKASKEDNNSPLCRESLNSIGTDHEHLEDLRIMLREKLLSLSKENDKPIPIAPGILKSEAYTELQKLITEGNILKETDPLWMKLEKTILETSPHFKEHLRLLTGGHLSSYDLHTSILVKCGISPLQIAHLLSKSKGAIVSRRESLCIRIFGENLGTKIIDRIIILI